MTQFVDFVALGWVEKSLREEVEAARNCLHRYQREPDQLQHLLGQRPHARREQARAR